MRVLGALSAVLFVLLALALYVAPEALDAVDVWAAMQVAPLQTLAGIQVFLALTALGGGVGIIAVAIGFAYIARLPTAQVLRLTFLLVAVAVADKVLKEAFVRARPDALAWFDALPSYSFPSAHASAALALYGFIAIVLYERTRRASYTFIPGLTILLVGLSRIVLGAHHFSDVIGGYLIGIAVLALALVLPFERLTQRYG